MDSLQILMLIGLVVILAAIGVYSMRRRSVSVPMETAPMLPGTLPSASSGFTELYFGPSSDDPLLTFSSLRFEDLPPEYTSIPPNSKPISRLNPLLQAVPSILTAAALEQGNYMRVIVSGQLATAADGQSLMPFVKGADGKISEMARLQDSGNLTNLANGAMAFQIVSVLVAQKHLADINKKLNEIKHGVDEIRAHQQDERAATITGSLKYLEQHIPSVLSGEFSDAVRNELEAIERSLVSTQDHLEKDIHSKIERISSITSDEMFGADNLKAEVERQQKYYQQLQQHWLLCIRARIANWQILSTFPNDLQLKSTRKSAIQSSIQPIMEISEKADDLWCKKIDSISAKFNLQTTLDEWKISLHQLRQSGLEVAAKNGGVLMAEIGKAEEQLLEYQRPITLALRVRQGKIIEALELR